MALEVHTDALVSVLESKSVHDHDENEENGERHGDPDDIGARVDTLPHDEVDDDPNGEGGEVHLPAEDRGRADHVRCIKLVTVVIVQLDDVLVEDPKTRE